MAAETEPSLTNSEQMAAGDLSVRLTYKRKYVLAVVILTQGKFFTVNTLICITGANVRNI
jgi:hypothetical protein